MTDTAPLRGPATINVWADDVVAAARWYAEFLGVEPYFVMPPAPEPPAYIEFRFGDAQTELGVVSRAFHPAGPDAANGGAIVFWHVDDLEATLARLLELGATAAQPVTDRGEGFATAAVTDPFGNLLGIMRNPHYVEMRDA